METREPERENDIKFRHCTNHLDKTLDSPALFPAIAEQTLTYLENYSYRFPISNWCCAESELCYSHDGKLNTLLLPSK